MQATYTYDYNHYGVPRITQDDSVAGHPKLPTRVDILLEEGQELNVGALRLKFVAQVAMSPLSCGASLSACNSALTNVWSAPFRCTIFPLRSLTFASDLIFS